MPRAPRYDYGVRTAAIRAICSRRVPAIESDHWPTAVYETGLYAFLEEPRTWDQIRAFARVKKLREEAIGHLLAYLDLQGDASAQYDERGDVAWQNNAEALRRTRGRKRA